MISICGPSRDIRSQIFEWTMGPSDVDGCVELHSGRIAKPVCKLSDKTVPVLSLVDELVFRGFVGVDKEIHHTRRILLEFDQRRLCSKRVYLQCLVYHEDGHPNM